MWKSFLGAVRFILTKYDPVSSHGDPVHANFGCMLVANLTFGMQVLSLDYIYIYIYVTGMQVLYKSCPVGDESCPVGDESCPVGDESCPGCKSCRRM